MKYLSTLLTILVKNGYIYLILGVEGLELLLSVDKLGEALKDERQDVLFKLAVTKCPSAMLKRFFPLTRVSGFWNLRNDVSTVNSKRSTSPEEARSAVGPWFEKQKSYFI